MRRIASAVFFTCLTLSLMAQTGIKVNYKGTKPTITDFVWAAFPSLNYEDEDESGDRPWKMLQNAMTRHSKGLPQEEGETLTIDTKNGYIVWEYSSDDYDHISRLEVCYWNEADGKHKLIAFNNMASFTEGRPCFTETCDFRFYRYNIATKRIVACDPPGFEIDYGCTYELPRAGKDIVATQWNVDGSSKQKVLKWNGRRFKH